MKKKLRGSILLALATIIWGSAFVSQSIGMDHIGPFTNVSNFTNDSLVAIDYHYASTRPYSKTMG